MLLPITVQYVQLEMYMHMYVYIMFRACNKNMNNDGFREMYEPNEAW